MMNHTRMKMRTVFICVVLCAFLGGCKKAQELVLISEEERTGRADAVKEESEQTESDLGLPPSPATICVYVCGAVLSPKVVELPAGSRAEDALKAAGGFSEDAEEAYVNLAARTEDGQMLYFPTREEARALRQAEEEAAKARVETQQGIVNINTANEEQLCTLPGIGKAKAADILSYREVNGAFGKPEDIMQVPGIKENAYARLKDKIAVE